MLQEFAQEVENTARAVVVVRDGRVDVTGNVTFNGNLTVTGTITAGGIDMNRHTHSGVHGETGGPH